jgi:hypothetical protein
LSPRLLAQSLGELPGLKREPLAALRSRSPVERHLSLDPPKRRELDGIAAGQRAI